MQLIIDFCNVRILGSDQFLFQTRLCKINQIFAGKNIDLTRVVDQLLSHENEKKPTGNHKGIIFLMVYHANSIFVFPKHTCYTTYMLMQEDLSV